MARKKELQRVTGRFMQELYEGEEERQWSDEQLMMIRRTGEYSSQVFSSGQPFQIDCLHIGLITKGEVNISVNLQPCHLSVGSLLVVTSESIMQMQGQTEGLDMQVLHVSDELVRVLLHPVHSEEKVLQGQLHHPMHHFVMHLTVADNGLLCLLFDTLWQSLHSGIPGLRDGQLLSVLRFVMHQKSQTVTPVAVDKASRNTEMVNSFLHLVNEHCHHRDLDFYAKQLCVSKSHLSNVVSENSAQTAREWIEQATMMRIKVMLQHGGLSLNEISEKMSFPEPSHFSRYFKRLAGVTPKEYRERN